VEIMIFVLMQLNTTFIAFRALHGGNESRGANQTPSYINMRPTEYRIDPNPDTVIYLQHPRSRFVDWDEYFAETETSLAGLDEPRETAYLVEEPKSLNFVDGTSNWRKITAKARKRLKWMGGSARKEGSTMPMKIAQGKLTTRQPEVSDANEKVECHYTYYHVSSQNLRDGSPIFKNMLSGEWKEGSRSDADEQFHISANDWDPEAFLVLMNIFHGRNDVVPQEMSIELLAKIAVLVDYYECGRAVEAFSSTWTQQLNEAVPRKFCRDLILWLCVAHVFNISDAYGKATAVALRYSTEEIPTFDLPISFALVGMSRANKPYKPYSD
jgi:hypothetical protein